MKSETLRAILVCSLFLLHSLLTTQAQVSFLQPPVYAGTGNLFVADFNRDGKPDLLTSDGTMNLGNGDGTFTAGTNVTVPTGLSVLAVADFNGDGKPDVLEQGTGTLLVQLGTGDGTFQTAISTPSGASLTLVAAADLNGDGKADVVGVFNGALSVYLGKGDGTFASPTSYNLGSIPARSLSLADFNGDGKIDIAVSTGASNGPAGQEIVFLGNGDGTFQAAKTSVGVSEPSPAVVGDFNADGKLDLAIDGCDPVKGCLTYVQLGNGDGTFQAPTPITTSSQYLAGPLAAGDFNDDGKDDLAIQADVGQIYLSNGDGTFSNASNYVLGFFGAGSGTAVADFNGDGKPDLAMDGVVLLGNGNGTFRGIQFSVVPSSGSQVVGDFNNNGIEDLAAVSNQSVYIVRNNGSGVLSLIHTYTLQQPGYAIVTGDFNGDGNLDLVVFGTDSATGDWNYSVLLGNGDGSFQSPVFYAESVQTTAQSYSVVVADFNNDKKLDIAVTSGNQTLALLVGKGDGTFAAPSYVFDGGASSLVSADFNGDGKADIAAGGPPLAILFGNGDGTFQTAVFPTSLQNFGVQFTADLNNDGKPDLVDGYQVALGNGDGTFTLLPSLPNQVNAIADFNGDGIPDVFVTEYYRAFVNANGVMLGNGDGTFGPLINVPTQGTLYPNLAPLAVLVADMNGDGLPDIVFPWGSTFLSGDGVLLNTTAKPVSNFSITSASGASTSQTVSAGQAAKFGLVLTPIAAFSGTVALSCTITPAVTPAPTCGLSSATLQIANATAQPVTVSITTTAPITTSALPQVVFPPGAMPLLWMVMLMGSACLWMRTRKRLPVLVAPTIVLLLASLVSCGGGGSSTPHTIPGTPSGTYTAKITANSGSLNHQMPVTVVVQ